MLAKQGRQVPLLLVRGQPHPDVVDVDLVLDRDHVDRAELLPEAVDADAELADGAVEGVVLEVVEAREA